MKILVRLLFLILAVLVATFDHTALSKAAGEIVTFCAIVSAGAVSAMIFSGTIMGARIRSETFELYEGQFWGKHQTYWFLMFAFATLCSVLVIFGQIIDWKLLFNINILGTTFTYDIARVLSFFVICSLGMSIALLIDFSRAVRDIVSVEAKGSDVNAVVRRTSKLKPSETADVIKTQP